MVNAMTKQHNSLGPEGLRFAECLFDASATLDAMRSGAPAAKPIGFSDIYSYVTDTDFEPGAEFIFALANDPRVRGDVAALLRTHAMVIIPEAAAAADDKEIEERVIPGWRILLRRVQANPDQVWVIVEHADKFASPPQSLFVGDVKQALPKSHEGRFQFRLSASSALVKALQDSSTEIFLL